MNTYPEYYHQEEDEFTLQEKLKYAFIGVLTIGGCFFIGRGVVRKAVSKNEQRKTATEGNPADYAQRLKMAFENDNWLGWGTDEAAIREVLTDIPSRDVFARVMSSYQKLYHRSLMLDLKDDLSTSEYNEMLAIINSKPEKITKNYKPVVGEQQYKGWAKRLKAAFQETNWLIFGGTDEAAVKAVFMEFPTQSALMETAKAYKDLYGDDLMYDLKDELTFGEFISMMSILKSKPEN